MTNPLKNWSVRQTLLCVATGMVILLTLVYQRAIRPAWDEWQASRQTLEMQAMRLARLERNLALRRTVERRFAAIRPVVRAPESDEIVLSRFLRELEMLSRRPSIVPVNMKPQKVESAPSYRTYPVKLTVAGRLAELLQFVDDVAAREDPTGVRSFSLRGVQGRDLVECTLSVWMVRLLPDGRAPAGRPPRTDRKGALAHGPS